MLLRNFWGRGQATIRYTKSKRQKSHSNLRLGSFTKKISRLIKQQTGKKIKLIATPRKSQVLRIKVSALQLACPESTLSLRTSISSFSVPPVNFTLYN